MVSLFNQVCVWGYLPGICKSRQNYCCNHFNSLSRSEQAEQGGRAQPACVTKVQYLLKWLFTNLSVNLPINHTNPQKSFYFKFHTQQKPKRVKIKEQGPNPILYLRKRSIKNAFFLNKSKFLIHYTFFGAMLSKTVKEM